MTQLRLFIAVRGPVSALFGTHRRTSRWHFGRRRTFSYLMNTPIGRRAFYPAWFNKVRGVHRTGFSAWARPRPRVCALVAAACAIAAGMAWSVASEANRPLHQRRAAFEMACRDAGDALLRLYHPSAITFADDCHQPKVTSLSNKPGYLIVTRVIEAQTGEAVAGRTYSALMDGRHVDAWRLIEARPAPNELSVVHAPPALSTVRNLPEH